jgi:hypothetical protein
MGALVADLERAHGTASVSVHLGSLVNVGDTLAWPRKSGAADLRPHLPSQQP